MKKNTIDIITLGCSKNLVDSERLMYLLNKAGFNVTHDPEHPQGEIAVINTCGFIGDAKEESINMILELCNLKEEGVVSGGMIPKLDNAFNALNNGVAKVIITRADAIDGKQGTHITL